MSSGSLHHSHDSRREREVENYLQVRSLLFWEGVSYTKAGAWNFIYMHVVTVNEQVYGSTNYVLVYCNTNGHYMPCQYCKTASDNVENWLTPLSTHTSQQSIITVLTNTSPNYHYFPHTYFTKLPLLSPYILHQTTITFPIHTSPNYHYFPHTYFTKLPLFSPYILHQTMVAFLTKTSSHYHYFPQTHTHFTKLQSINSYVPPHAVITTHTYTHTHTLPKFKIYQLCLAW